MTDKSLPCTSGMMLNICTLSTHTLFQLNNMPLIHNFLSTHKLLNLSGYSLTRTGIPKASNRDLISTFCKIAITQVKLKLKHVSYIQTA